MLVVGVGGSGRILAALRGKTNQDLVIDGMWIIRENEMMRGILLLLALVPTWVVMVEGRENISSFTDVR